MEIEEETVNSISERERKICRIYTNGQLDIFKSNGSFAFRPNKVNAKYENSYEHNELQNNSASILSSASNLFLYAMSNNFPTLHQAKAALRRNFYDTEQNKIMGLTSAEIEKENEKILLKLDRESFEGLLEYERFAQLIDNPNFDHMMRNDRTFLNTIIRSPLLAYHPRRNEILEAYQNFNNNI